MAKIDEKTITAKFVQDKPTKNTVRFAEKGSDHIGTLYVKNAAYEQLGSPAEIEVTIKAG
jgi:hypothetical protein